MAEGSTALPSHQVLIYEIISVPTSIILILISQYYTNVSLNYMFVFRCACNLVFVVRQNDPTVRIAANKYSYSYSYSYSH